MIGNNIKILGALTLKIIKTQVEHTHCRTVTGERSVTMMFVTNTY